MRKLILVAVVILILGGCRAAFTGSELNQVNAICVDHGGIKKLYTGHNRVICEDDLDINIKFKD